MTLNFDELMKKAEKVVLPKAPVSSGGGKSKATFGIVNSQNGKRLSFSKALFEQLALDKTVQLLPMADEGVVMIAKKLPFQNALDCKLSSQGGKKITYDSTAVAMVTEAFGLNFKGRTSMSFDEIQFEQLPNGTPVALVKVYNKNETVDDKDKKEGAEQ